MRNLGFSIFDIFFPIAIAIFVMGLMFLIIINPLSVLMETEYDIKINNKEESLYSIKISNNEMWIKNEVDEVNSSFINIKNVDLMDMKAKDIKILLLNNKSNKFLLAETGIFKDNLFLLNKVKHYNFEDEDYKILNNYKLNINFNKDNIINSISKFKLIPFYKYISHSKTLNKFNLYSPEIGFIIYQRS